MPTPLLLAVLLVALPAVQACSCPVDAFQVSRSEAITRDFCANFSPAVYSGVVVSATCNCIPGSDGVSSSLNCQQYQLNPANNTVSANTLTMGVCEFRDYQDFYYNPVCSDLGSAVAGALLIETSDSPVERTNLTDSTRCREACPMQSPQDDPFFFVPQPCTYTVRVTESFKGRYAQDSMVTVSGPDIATSCGTFGRRLVLGTSYVVGIGGPCSPIGEWSLLSSYNSEELELLRTATLCDTVTTAGTGGTSEQGGVTTSPVVTVGGAMGVAPAVSLLGLMLLITVLRG